MKRSLTLAVILVVIVGLSGCSLSPRTTVQEFISGWNTQDAGKIADVLADTVTEYYQNLSDDGYSSAQLTRQEEVTYYADPSDFVGIDHLSYIISDEEVLEGTAHISGILTYHWADGTQSSRSMDVDLAKSSAGKWEICTLRFGRESTTQSQSVDRMFHR